MAIEKPFAEFTPSERAQFAQQHPEVYRAAHTQWAQEIADVTSKRNSAVKMADRQALTARLGELTKNGLPSKAA